MIVGLLISYGVLLPTLTWGDLPADADVSDVVSSTFGTEVRFVGAGAIAVAAVWTLLKILGPIVRGIRAAAVSSRARRGGGTVELTERDLPIGIVGGTIAVSLIPIACCCGTSCPARRSPTRRRPTIVVSLSTWWCSVRSSRPSPATWPGSSARRTARSPGWASWSCWASPCCWPRCTGPATTRTATTALVAYSLFTTAVVFSVATISNDNLQDLKTGQLVGATPWKQQVALVIGVVFGSLVIAPVLDLLNTAFGFAGAPGAGDDALAAPQAALISALARACSGAT